MASKRLYRVVLPYAVFGTVIVDGWVVEAAPIGRWMLGKLLNVVRAWVVGKRGILEDCSA